MQVGLIPGHIVFRWGLSSPTERATAATHFHNSRVQALSALHPYNPQPMCILANVYCGQTARWIKIPFGTKLDMGSGHIVLDGDPTPPPKKKGHSSPQFPVHVYCRQTAGCIQMKLGIEVGLGPGHIVLDADPVPLLRSGTATQFSAHVCCGQTAVWIKMPLSTEVGLGPRHVVLDGDPSPSPPKGHSPQFSVHVYCGQTVAHLNYFFVNCYSPVTDRQTIETYDYSIYRASMASRGKN